MSHPLEQQVHRVARRARRLQWTWGAGWWIVWLLGTILVVGSVDYVFRWQETGTRFLLSAAAAAIIVWAAWRFLLPAWYNRASLLDVARRIERHHPQLQDRLSSTIAFLNQPADDPRAGSISLRRSVIAETQGFAERLDFGDCLDSRHPRRALFAAATALLLAAGVMLADVSTGLLALQRMAQPWSDTAWPRRHHLEFRDAPRQLAAGDDLQLEVIDSHGARLPDNVTLQYRTRQDGPPQQRAMISRGPLATVEITNVTGPLQYRAVGGDDDTMPWISLDVIEPPEVVSSRIQLHPPAYTGQPPRSSGQEIRAVAGTRIEVEAETSKPVRAVRLRQESGETQPVAIEWDEGGRSFRLPADSDQPWIAEQSGTYRFELEDQNGLSGGQSLRLSLHVEQDRPPTVSLEKPSQQQPVTTTAVVPLRALVKDDFGIQQVSLVYQTSRQETRSELELYRADHPPEADEDEAASSGDTLTIETEWALSGLGLEAGDWVELYVRAKDFLPQTGESSKRRLTIVSEEDFAERALQRQSYLLNRIRQALQMQRDARSQTRALEVQWEETGSLAPQDVDALKSVELAQRQVDSLLVGADEGVRALIARLRRDLQSARTSMPELQQTLDTLDEAIAELEQGPLPVIRQELNTAWRDAREAVRDAEPQQAQPAPQSVGDSILTTRENQDRVISRLEQLVGQVSTHENRRQFAQAIRRLQQQQQQLHERTQELRLNQLSRRNRAAEAEHRVGIRQAAEEQQELARQFDRLLNRMEQAEDESASADPDAARVLRETIEEARSMALGGRMREAGQDLEQDRLGQAEQQQDGIQRDLADLHAVLDDRRDGQLDRQIRDLEDVAEAVDDLIAQQHEQQDAIRQAEEAEAQHETERRLEQLARRQEELARRAEEIADQVQPLDAGGAESRLRRAASSMSESAQAASGGDSQQAGQEAEQAQSELTDARSELARAIQQRKQDLLHEQVARLEHHVAGFIVRQEEVIQETERLEQLHDQQGQWTRAQQASVQVLADQQEALAEEVGDLAVGLSGADAFVLGLESARQDMMRAAQRLHHGQVDQTTRALEENALASLRQIFESLQPDPPSSGESPPPNGDEEEIGPLVDAVRALAELKLLRAMQQQINERTEQLEQQAADGPLAEEQTELLAQLAQQQGQLAEILLRLAAVDDAEEEPAADPDDRPSDWQDPLDLDDLDRALEESLQF